MVKLTRLNTMKIKTLFLILLSSLIGMALHAVKEEEVPQPARDLVIRQYPKAVKVDWDFEKEDGYYEAEFEIDKLKYELYISPGGELLRSKEQILIKDVPDPIATYVQTHHPDHVIRKAVKITRYTYSIREDKPVRDETVNYEVDIRKGMLPLGDKEMLFNDKGDLIEIDD